MIVIARLPAHIDHAVDGGGAAQHAAARIVEGPPVEAGHGFRLEAPIGARIAHAIKVSDWDMDPEIIVAAARFQQQHPITRIDAEAVGEHTARRARPDDDIVELADGLQRRSMVAFGSLCGLHSCEERRSEAGRQNVPAMAVSARSSTLTWWELPPRGSAKTKSANN